MTRTEVRPKKKAVSPPAKWLKDQTAREKRKKEGRTRETGEGAGEGETRKEKAERKQRGNGEEGEQENSRVTRWILPRIRPYHRRRTTPHTQRVYASHCETKCGGGKEKAAWKHQVPACNAGRQEASEQDILFCPGDRADPLVPSHLCAAVYGAQLRRPMLGHAFHYGLELASEGRYGQDHGSACSSETVESLLHRGPVCGEPSTNMPAKSLPQGSADATASHSRSRDTFGGKSGHELQDRRRSGTGQRPGQGGTSTYPAPVAVRAERQRRGRRRAVGVVGAMVPGARSQHYKKPDRSHEPECSCAPDTSSSRIISSRFRDQDPFHPP